MGFNENLSGAVTGRFQHIEPNITSEPSSEEGTVEQTSTLDFYVQSFYDVDKNAKYFEKQASTLKTKIKQLMEKEGLKEYTVNGIKVTYSEVITPGYDSEKLMTILKESSPEDLQQLVIKTTEYVDLTVLAEDILYHKKMEAAVLKPAMIENKVNKLLIKKLKGGSSAASNNS